jgi:molecular chaperone GrpE
MDEKEKMNLEEEMNPEDLTPEARAAQRENEETETEIEATVEDIEALQNQLIDTQSKLEKAVKDLDDTKNVFQRTLAEYDNFRKRTAKEKAETFNNGVISAVNAIIPVIDSLEMARNAPTEDENYKKGIEMTLTSAQNALKKLGVEEIEALDKPFDPNIHSAVMQSEKEGVEPGIVIRQFQKGYRMGDRVIRPATVTVSC